MRSGPRIETEPCEPGRADGLHIQTARNHGARFPVRFVTAQGSQPHPRPFENDRRRPTTTPTPHPSGHPWGGRGRGAGSPDPYLERFPPLLLLFWPCTRLPWPLLRLLLLALLRLRINPLLSLLLSVGHCLRTGRTGLCSRAWHRRWLLQLYRLLCH